MVQIDIKKLINGFLNGHALHSFVVYGKSLISLHYLRRARASHNSQPHPEKKSSMNARYHKKIQYLAQLVRAYLVALFPLDGFDLLSGADVSTGQY